VIYNSCLHKAEFVSEAIAEAGAIVRVSLNKIDFGEASTATSKGVTKSIQKMFAEAQEKYLSEEIEVNDHPNSFFETHSIANLLGER
jgi:hypothetical protein